MLERPRGELLLFREGHLVEEALLGKMRTTGSTAFLRQVRVRVCSCIASPLIHPFILFFDPKLFPFCQPHLATICARLRRDYPRLAEGMDAALLLELGDNYSPRALGLKELVEVLVSWQW